MIKTILFSLITLFFVAHGVWYAFTSHFNFGSVMVWGIAVSSACYALFHRQIDRFTASGFGLFLKILFELGCVFFAICMVCVLWGQFGNRANQNEDFLIVLGCAIRGDRPSTVLRYRLDAAFDYYQENETVTIVVSGGQGVNEIMPEAAVMKQYLVNKGVPETQILTETTSTSTEENFRFSKQVLVQNGFDVTEDTTTAYVTNGFHCARAGLYAHNEGFAHVKAVSAGMPVTQLLTCYLREGFAMAYYFVFKSPNRGFLKNYVGLL